MDKKDASLCLSGMQKPISKKEESLREKLMEKVKLPTLQLGRLDGIRKDRPKTAVKKKSQSRPNSLSRPTSASIQPKFKHRSRMPSPGLKQAGSIDSALSSQHSSAEQTTDEENDPTDDHCSNNSTEDLSEDDCSVDSGIIKVRISRGGNDQDGRIRKEKEQEVLSPSPITEPILVKEFNRTPDIPIDEHEDNIGLCIVIVDKY